MAALEIFIKTYTEELRTLIGQIPKEHWIIFPDFFYLPYIIRARKCPNGVAILFKRPANRESITVKSSKKRAEEVFLPYLPPPTYFAVFDWTNATRIWHMNHNFINWDWSIDPVKGKKFQNAGEDFHRMSVMHLDKSCEIQVMNCRLSGVSDYGRVSFLIRFLWMMTENCVELTEEKAKSYANNDFARFLNHILFVWAPSRLSSRVKMFLIGMLKELESKFEELISRTDVDEAEVQDFLEDHTSITDLNAKRVLSKECLGRTNQADFILIYADSIRVVEIKKPFDPIFEKEGFSSVASLALSELTRYQNWLKLNESEAKERYGSAVLKKGWGIIGRVKNMNEEQMKELILYDSKSEETIIRTYDDLLENFSLRISQIEKL
jgi:hypothetical protein